MIFLLQKKTRAETWVDHTVPAGKTVDELKMDLKELHASGTYRVVYLDSNGVVKNRIFKVIEVIRYEVFNLPSNGT